MKKLNIALLAGGNSSEREISLRSGREVFSALDKTRYNIFFYDTKTDIPKLINDAPEIDAALIILHGPYGEDGRMQGMLDILGIPYQGSGVLGSAVGMNKLATKRLLGQAGIATPAYEAIYRTDRVAETGKLVEKLGLPLVIKPVSGGSSIGMSIVKDISDIEAALEQAFLEDDTVLVEEYIAGRELTCGIIGSETSIEALPVIEIIPGREHSFFDYAAKYTSGEAEEVCPAKIDESVAEKVKNIAADSHRALFCRIYSRTDMILAADGKIYVLETNTIPGMTANSLLPKSAGAAGYTFTEFLDRLIALSLENRCTGRLS